MTERTQILVIDDELLIRRMVGMALGRAGFAPLEAENATRALAQLQMHHPAAAIVDLSLPDMDGLDLVTELARRGGIAIIVLSARDATSQKIAALDRGADDFVSKPFDSGELLARLRSSLRRLERVPAAGGRIEAGRIVIDETGHVVSKDGREVHLTPREFALLVELARQPGRVVTHAHLLRKVWGPSHVNDIEYLRVAARSLRQKLEDDPSRPALLRNEPGVGYRLIAGT